MKLSKHVYFELHDLAINNYTIETFAILFSQGGNGKICKMVALENKFDSPFLVGVSKDEFKKCIDNNSEYCFSGIFHSHVSSYNMNPNISVEDVKLMKMHKNLMFIIAHINQYREIKLISYQCPFEGNNPFSKTIEL